jgi:predicted transcriptional regulator
MSTEPTQLPTRNNLYGFEYREEDLRRAFQGERRAYDIKQLWQVHHEIINLRAMGYKEPVIAKLLNLHPQTVSNTLNSTLGEIKLAEVRKERDEDAKQTVEQIRILRDKALQVYSEIFDADISNPTIGLKDKLHVADTVLLELSGLKVPTKIHSITSILTSEELADMKARGLEECRKSGLIVDVEAEEVKDES